MTSGSGGDGVDNGGGDEAVHRWGGGEIQFIDEKLHQTRVT